MQIPGHRAPTAGPTTTLELLNGGGGDSTDDVSLQGGRAASKHATQLTVATLITLSSDKTLVRRRQTNVSEETEKM